MKKLVLTIAIALMMGNTIFAQEGGGALKRSKQYEHARTENNMRGNGFPMLPSGHGLSDHYDATGGTPLGSGMAVLLGLGVAYLVGKKRREE